MITNLGGEARSAARLHIRFSVKHIYGSDINNMVLLLDFSIKKNIVKVKILTCM